MTKICSINSCNKKYFSKNLCKNHYSKLYYNNRKNGIFTSIPKGKNHHWWKGGVAEYPNHFVMKKNRLIKLTEHKICEHCKERPATEIHHIDEGKTNHELDNLMAVCHKCNISKLRSKKLNNSKYRILYGKTLKEMGNKYNLTPTGILSRFKRGIPLSRKKWEGDYHYNNFGKSK